MPYVNLKGRQIFFSEKGSQHNHTIVFVHGAGCDHRVWCAQLDNLSKSYRTISVDLPGHGLSDGLSLQSISLYTKFVYDFMEKVVPRGKAILCGHSMGGAITLNYALDYPFDLRGIILVATGSRLKVSQNILDTYSRGEYFDQLIGYAISRNAGNEVEKLVSEIIKSIIPRVCFNDYTACDNFDISERLTEITLPTLVVGGAEDVLTPLKYSEIIAENINDSILEVADGSGHFIPLEKPGFLNRMISDFVDAVLRRKE